MCGKRWRISLLLLCFYINVNSSYGILFDIINDGLSTIIDGIGLDAAVIDLAGNSLTSIGSSAFSSYTNLESLVLSNNNISNIANDAFNGLTTVLELHLDGNALTTFPDFGADLGSSLLILDLARNNISYIPINVHYNFLTDLNLANNPIDWIDGSLDGVVTYSASLITLDVSGTGCTG